MDPIITNHTGFDVEFDQSFPLLCMGILFFIFATSKRVRKYIRRKFLSSEHLDDDDEDKFDVDEGLGEYIERLGSVNRKEWYAEEILMKNKLGFSTVNEEWL